MTIFEAADKLQERLGNPSWLNSIGAGEIQSGEKAIFVYLTSSFKNSELEELKMRGWHGYPVRIERVGTTKALRTKL